MEQITHAAGDNIKLAVLAIVFTVFALSLGDALIKRVSVDFPLWQIFVVRSVIAVPVLIAVIKVRNRPLSLMPLKPGWTALRSVMLTFMWVAYYSALPQVALSVAAAVYYTLPLFITLFAALFIGEKVSPRGWMAVLLGFTGVLLVLKPHAEDFNGYALLPLVSAILYAFAMIITRTKCRTESPMVLSFGLNVSFLGVGILAIILISLWGPSNALTENHRFLLGRWIPMGTREWLAGGLLATAFIVGSWCAAVAYQRGPSSIVSTFDVGYLAFAALWGFLFFSEVPDAMTFFGIILITTAGILVIRRPRWRAGEGGAKHS